MYGRSSRSASGSITPFSKSFVILLRLPVSEDGNEERALRTKQRRQVLYRAPLWCVANSVKGLCFTHLVQKALDSVEEASGGVKGALCGGCLGIEVLNTSETGADAPTDEMKHEKIFSFYADCLLCWLAISASCL